MLVIPRIAHLAGVRRRDLIRRVARYGRLTISAACTNVVLLIRRTVHLDTMKDSGVCVSGIVGPKALTISELLEVIGGLVSALRAYAANLPAVVSLSAMPGGLKPAPEAVAAYEQTVYRCRSQGAASPFRGLIDLLIESLESFESGRLLGAIQPLLMVLDRLGAMQRDKELAMTTAEEQRIREYRTSLNKILPGNQPELDGAGKGL